MTVGFEPVPRVITAPIQKSDLAMIAPMHDSMTRRKLMLGCAASAMLLLAGGDTGARARQNAAIPYLVSVDWLADRIERAESNLLVMDVSDLRSYRDAHIPGAIHSFWLETVERDYDVFGTVLNQKNSDSDEDGQGKRLAWLRRHGIGPQTHVVAYDRNDGLRAARIVWFLRFLGHERVSMLDQGFEGWSSSGAATSTGEETPPEVTTDPVVTPLQGFYIGTDELEELIRANSITLVDIRSDDQRQDTIDGQFEIGAIPGSIRAPWNDAAFDVTAWPEAFDPAAALTRLQETGIDPNARVVLYGLFGSDCDQMWVVLKAAGIEDVVIYDRGWAEWSRFGLISVPIT